MDALIYTLMSGADRAMRAQQVHANNLANIDTAGFRANLELADSNKVEGYGYDTRYMSQLQADSLVLRAKQAIRWMSRSKGMACWLCRLPQARRTRVAAR